MLPSQYSGDELLTVDDVAALFKVSRMTIWRWCNSGRLPAFKIGREWRIHRRELDALVQQQMKAANSNGHTGEGAPDELSRSS